MSTPPRYAWDPIIENPRNARTGKPRECGLTMIIDAGTPLGLTGDILEMSAHLVDHWKLSFGTSVLVERELLERKLALLREHDVLTYPGGTLLEVALVEHHCRVYMRHARALGFTAVEISDGTIPVPRFRRRKIIDCAVNAGLVPITEVGKKDPKRQPTPDQIAEEALEDLEWGAEWVIVEGRESGTGIGVFDEAGRVEDTAVERIAELMPEEATRRLIWEAPLKPQQAFLIERFGPNVNFGNISPAQVSCVEALRRGLRFETLHPLTEVLVREGRWDPEQTEPDNGEAAVAPGMAGARTR